MFRCNLRNEMATNTTVMILQEFTIAQIRLEKQHWKQKMIEPDLLLFNSLTSVVLNQYNIQIMPINPKTPGIHHISLRCKDMAITKQFYQTTLGLNLVYDSPTLMGFLVGSVMIGFRINATVCARPYRSGPLCANEGIDKREQCLT